MSKIETTSKVPVKLTDSINLGMRGAHVVYKPSDGLEKVKEPEENLLSRFVNAGVWLPNSFWLKFCLCFENKITILYSLLKLYKRAVL